jgi:uncharacterized RDD family membrane protein YckC
MPPDVFISYANDDKFVADNICTKLEENQISCWIAPRDIIPGDRYVSSLLTAIKNARIVVVIFSRNADKSPHVKTEVERAFNLEKTIIPFRIENIEPSEELQYFIGNRQWLNAITPPMEDHIKLLTNVIQTQIDPQLKEGKSIQNTEYSQANIEETHLAIPAHQSDDSETQEIVSSVSSSDELIYVGFWKRLVAGIIDLTIIGVLLFTIWVIIALIYMGITGGMNSPKYQLYISFFGGLIVLTLVIIPIIYSAYLESSKTQATLGKKLLKFKVINKNQERISLKEGVFRALLKIFSIMIVIGILIIGFTGKKQGLHDLIVGTYVIE